MAWIVLCAAVAPLAWAQPTEACNVSETVFSSLRGGGVEGYGTASEPYELGTPADVRAMEAQYLELANQGRSDDACWGAHFVMTNDVTLTGPWTPIGHDDTGWVASMAFSGTFDGDGFTLANLAIDAPGDDDMNAVHAVGLFAALEQDEAGGVTTTATVRDVVLSNVAVDAPDARGVGVVAGRARGAEIVDVTITDGVVSGQEDVGGVVGQVEGVTLDGVDVGVEVRGEQFVGGLVGYVGEDAASAVGGLFVNEARARGLVQRPVDDATYKYVGGIVGIADLVATTDVESLFALVDVVVHERVEGMNLVGGVVGALIADAGDHVELVQVDVRAGVRGDQQVGGIVGLLSSSGSRPTMTLRATVVGGTLDVALAYAGGLVARLNGADLDVADVLVDAPLQSYSPTSNPFLGGLVVDPDAGDTVEVRRTLVRHPPPEGALCRGSDASDDCVVSAADVFYAGPAQASQAGTPLSAPEVLDPRVFRAAGWPLQPGPVADGTTWGFCKDAGPHLAWMGTPDPCDPVDVATSLSVASPEARPRTDVPFDVEVALFDDLGDAYGALAGSTLTLSATGGPGDGSVRTVQGGPGVPVTATLAAGATTATFEDVLVTGFEGSSVTDLQLHVAGSGGSADALSATSVTLSLVDTTVSLATSRDRALSDGVEEVIATARFRDATGAAVVDQPVTFTTDVGGWWHDGASVGRTRVVATDATGGAQAALRSDGEAGDAQVRVACLGACSATDVVAFVEPTELRIVPGAGVAWVYPLGLPDAATAVAYRLDGGPWTSFATDGIVGPLRIDGLRPGATYALDVRVDTPDGIVEPYSRASLRLPEAVVAPEAPVEPEGTPAVATRDGDRLTATWTVRWTHESAEALEEAWVSFDPPPGARVVEAGVAEGSPGRLTREPEAWRWAGPPWEPGAVVAFDVTVAWEGERP
ncbi:MAG: Ig-like domain-containing protein [Trueperaceae bacterium]|nr:Ig-like domain-containing protein [Trueperaceae bacterium]